MCCEAMRSVLPWQQRELAKIIDDFKYRRGLIKRIKM